MPKSIFNEELFMEIILGPGNREVLLGNPQ